jgi:hypothetical protein
VRAAWGALLLPLLFGCAHERMTVARPVAGLSAPQRAAFYKDSQIRENGPSHALRGLPVLWPAGYFWKRYVAGPAGTLGASERAGNTRQLSLVLEGQRLDRALDALDRERTIYRWTVITFAVGALVAYRFNGASKDYSQNEFGPATELLAVGALGIPLAETLGGLANAEALELYDDHLRQFLGQPIPLREPRVAMALQSAALPGWGQAQQGYWDRAVSNFLLGAGGLAMAVAGTQRPADNEKAWMMAAGALFYGMNILDAAFQFRPAPRLSWNF